MLAKEVSKQDSPEWLNRCSEGGAFSPVEDALGLNHMVIWRELKDKAMNIVLTEHEEPFRVRHSFESYDPLCDSPEFMIMDYSIRTQDYTDYFQSLLQEYCSIQRFPQIKFYSHQSGFLKSYNTLIFLNPYREVSIEGALDSRYLFIRENGKRETLRLVDSSKRINTRTSYGWIFDFINLKLEHAQKRFLHSMLFDRFTPSDYFFFMYDKYRDIAISDYEYELDLGKWTFQMTNGDEVTFMGDSYWGHGYSIDFADIRINDCRIEKFFIPLNTIPSNCISNDYSTSVVECLPDYYFAFHNPYSHAMSFPLHIVEHLPIQCYDPPYVILEASVKNTPIGMYFR